MQALCRGKHPLKLNLLSQGSNATLKIQLRIEIPSIPLFCQVSDLHRFQRLSSRVEMLSWCLVKQARDLSETEPPPKKNQTVSYGLVYYSVFSTTIPGQKDYLPDNLANQSCKTPKISLKKPLAANLQHLIVKENIEDGCAVLKHFI